jgi:hypothetical protein
MKLTRAEVEVRESFITRMFELYPTLTIRAAQARIVDKFSKQMRNKRLLEIRAMVLKGKS